MMKQTLRIWGWSLVLLLGLVAGCSSSPDGAGTGKYAAVELNGFSRFAVEMAVQQVFENEGYKLASKSNDSLVFEREASKGQTVMWGTWSSLWERVVTKITRLGEGDRYLLSADAYRVKDKDDKIMEEEKKMGFAVQSKYQKLLEQVKTLLAPMPKASGS